jgi:hypothetical protein
MLFDQFNVQSIDEFEVDQRGQVKVKEIVFRERKVSELEDTKELKPHNFA